MASKQSLVGIAQSIVKELTGGVFSQDGKYSQRHVMELVRQARAQAIDDYFTKSRMRSVDPNWLQTYTPTYDPAIQDNSKLYMKWVVPAILSLPKGAGVFWVGGVNDVNRDYDGVENRGMASNYQKHRHTKMTNDRTTTAVYESGYLYVYGASRSSRAIQVQAVWDDPMDLPDFDEENSEYPITATLIPMVKDLVKKELGFVPQVRPDYVNDGKETR